MTIECYYSSCKYHGAHSGEEGPFCFEEECCATEYEIRLHELIAVRTNSVRKLSETCGALTTKLFVALDELDVARSQKPVAWRYRRIDPEEGPSVWSVTTDPRDFGVVDGTVGGRFNYEVQPLKVV